MGRQTLLQRRKSGSPSPSLSPSFHRCRCVPAECPPLAHSLDPQAVSVHRPVGRSVRWSVDRSLSHHSFHPEQVGSGDDDRCGHRWQHSTKRPSSHPISSLLSCQRSLLSVRSPKTSSSSAEMMMMMRRPSTDSDMQFSTFLLSRGPFFALRRGDALVRPPGHSIISIR